MYNYALSSLVSFILLSMGIISVILGAINYLDTRKTKSALSMLYVFITVFFWNFGYAWMGLCYDSDIAYFARAISLLAVTFYMYYVLKYVSILTNYPKKYLDIFIKVFMTLSLFAWFMVIQKNAVSFVVVPWGYWYTSKITPFRIIQFASILAALIEYYVIIGYGIKNSKVNREKYVFNIFKLFGIILFFGYTIDTLLPSLLDIPAVPGSAVSAFISAMIIYVTSIKYRAFGLTSANISDYVFKKVSIPVIVTDHNDKIVTCNDITENYLDSTLDNIISLGMNYYFREFEPNVYQIFNKNNICTLNTTIVNDRFGDMIYTIHFINDITKERENIRLLEESRYQAERANSAKSDFLANMSHEIRTPINAVLGMDELIIRETNNSNILEYAANIKQSGNILLSLINDILDFSKIESGKMDIIDVEYNTKTVLADTYALINTRAKKKGLAVVFDIDPSIPKTMFGDDIRIRQIITNLLTNAVKYTEKGTITLTIKVIASYDNNILLNFSIKDTGVGIKDEDKEKLFMAFQRVDESKNRNIEGTGLGLSICIKLLQLMDSNLSVKSEYGNGSEFYFDITQKIIDPTPIGIFETNSSATAPSSMLIPDDYGTFTAPDATILVVDDNEMNLKVVKGLLKQTKINVVTAFSGPESIELVKNNKYDVILMDHMMPDMDGIEAVKIMKEMPDNMSANSPIIALTANAVIGAKEMFLDNGFDDFLSKPVKGTDLEKMLYRYLPSELIIK